MTDVNSLAARNIIFREACNVNPHSPTPAVGPVKINWEKKKKKKQSTRGLERKNNKWEGKKNRRRRKRGFTQDFRHTEGEGGRNEQQKKQGSNEKKSSRKLPNRGDFGSPRPGISSARDSLWSRSEKHSSEEIQRVFVASFFFYFFPFSYGVARTVYAPLPTDEVKLR